MPWALKALFGREAHIFNTHKKVLEIRHDSVLSNPVYLSEFIIDMKRTKFIKVLIQLITHNKN